MAKCEKSDAQPPFFSVCCLFRLCAVPTVALPLPFLLFVSCSIVQKQFIKSFPDAYATDVGTGGLQLSGGQKQVHTVAVR